MDPDLGPFAEPEEVGLSSSRLARIGTLLQSHVDEGVLPGAVALVHRRGRTAYVTEAGTMTTSSIFRMYSMTKLITGIAALSLAEEGLLGLGDPVGKHLPSLADVPVGESTGDGGYRLVEPRREMTLLDLLRHTSGVVGGYLGTPWMLKLYEEAGIREFDHSDAAYAWSSADFVAALGKLPLGMHPGAHWEYGRSGDVAGHLLEVVSGLPLDELLRRRVFEPLGMSATGFHVPPEQAHLIAQPTTSFMEGTKLRDLTTRPTFLSGGSGGYSTIGDYLRLTRMLLAGGGDVLGRKSVELLTADHLGPLYGSGPDYIPGDGYTFGLGVAVRRDTGGDVLGSVGDYWWLGRGTTSFFVDPAEELIGIMMSQKYWNSRPYQKMFKNLVLQSVVD